MPKTTRKQNAVVLSPLEQRVFDMLPRTGERITTKDIRKTLWPRNEPIHARVRVISVLRTLERKIQQVKRSPRQGPTPVEVWLDQKMKREQ